MNYANRLINTLQLTHPDMLVCLCKHLRVHRYYVCLWAVVYVCGFACACQVTRRLTTELKDMKMARNMEREVQQEKVVSDLKRQLEELNAARERQVEILKTVTDSR